MNPFLCCTHPLTIVLQRYRLSQQFVNSETLNGRKENFSITLDEIESHRNLLMDMAKEAMNFVRAHATQSQLQAGQTGAQAMAPQESQQGRNAPAAAAAAAAAAAQAQPAASAAQAPAEETPRAPKHKRSNSKANHQPPTAPTTAQPPFPLHGASPHGQPAYIGKPSVTQETLHLPTTKRRKTNSQVTAPSPITAQTPAATTPSTKGASPEVKRRQASEAKAAAAAAAAANAQSTATAAAAQQAAKALFYCTENDCDMKSTGFATEEARRVHVEEEHTKPAADPFKFVTDALSEALGLDAQGHAKTTANGTSMGTNAPSMTSTASKQGLTPATPMSRVTSMNRQTSNAGAGGKAAPSKGAAGNGLGATPKAPDLGLQGSAPSIDTDVLLASASLSDAWDFANVDPQDLASTFSFAADTAAHGAIADFSVYRSMITPNDTPESRTDSGWASEPTSDILESTNLDLNIDMWTTSEDGTIMPSMLDDMQKFFMHPIDETDTSDQAQMFLNDVPSGFGDDETDMVSMFNKTNVELDPSLYSFGAA